MLYNRSIHRTSVLTRKDSTVYSTTTISTRPTQSQHRQILLESDAERRLQALDECTDNLGDAQLTCTSSSSKTTRRSNVTTALNVSDVDELCAWPRTVSRTSTDQSQQSSHSGKTNRLRLSAAEVTSPSLVVGYIETVSSQLGPQLSSLQQAFN